MGEPGRSGNLQNHEPPEVDVAADRLVVVC